MIQAPQDHRDGDAQRHAPRHERRICRLLRHRHGAAEREERHHRARHHVPDPPLGAGGRRQLVERHDLRGHRSRPDHPRARLRRPLHQPPLRLWAAARQLSRLQAPARPLGLWRLPDHEEALAALPAGPQPADPRAEARVHARLAVLARRGKRRRAGRAAQPDLGAVRRHRRHRHPRQDPDHPDPRRIRGFGAAFRLALPAARRDPRRPDARRGVCRHGAAMDRGARGRRRPDQGPPAVRAHRQGRLGPPQCATSRRSGRR